jgi:glycosyltransferase involved in cell wall biosynthesis
LAARLVCHAIKQRAAAILCVSSFTASEFMKVTGAQHRALHVAHSGVDRSWFEIPRDGEPHPRPYLLAVGDVKPHKNYCGLIEAFALLAGEIPHDLVIVGRTGGFVTGDPAVFTLAAKYAGRIVFTGRIPKERLQRYYAYADALVYPSFYEGFGLPPLEAMASGVPVIAAGVAAIPEVCGNAALYCDPNRPADIATKIRALLNSDGLRQELIGEGVCRARQFTWERTAEVTFDVIEQAIRA